jgi:hypothetical protein
MADDPAPEEGLSSFSMSLTVEVDPRDVVKGLGNNDESLLAFISQMLELADSSDLRERLAERLVEWDAEHPS